MLFSWKKRVKSRTYRSVEDRQLPILLVVDLSETGRYQRDPTYARQRDGIAPGAEVFSACERVGRPSAAGRSRFSEAGPSRGRIAGAVSQPANPGAAANRCPNAAAPTRRVLSLKQRVHPHQAAESVRWFLVRLSGLGIRPLRTKVFAPR